MGPEPPEKAGQELNRLKKKQQRMLLVPCKFYRIIFLVLTPTASTRQKPVLCIMSKYDPQGLQHQAIQDLIMRGEDFLRTQYVKAVVRYV